MTSLVYNTPFALRLTGVRKPADTPLYGDTYDADNKAGCVRFQGNGKITNMGFNRPHGNRGNVLFFDNHAATLNKTGLAAIESFPISASYNQGKVYE